MIKQAEILDTNVIRLIRIAAQLEKNNADIAYLLERARFLSGTDPMYLTRTIKDKIVPYADKIVARDERFFMAGDELLNKYVGSDDSRVFVAHFVRMLQESATKVSSREKEIIWKHLDAIVAAATAFNAAEAAR